MTDNVSLISASMLATMKELALAAPVAPICEVGVYRGGSAVVLAEVASLREVPLHLYDTFRGIPVKSSYDTHRIGDFADTSIDEVRARVPSALLHVGLFTPSMPVPGRVGFVHADADQYESSISICRAFTPVMAAGGMILFDDYSALEGCKRGVDQCFPSDRIQILPDGRALVRF